MPYLRLAGFGDVALIRRFDLRPNLLSASVERWCTETHTFIMPCGDCTITLEDIAMQLGLRVDGDVVTGRSKVLEPSVVCHRLLGGSLRDGEQNFTCLTLAWLRANFKQLSSTTTEQEVISYSWGSVMLAVLYYELCCATKHGVSNMAGCLGLLQSWALYRMPFLVAVRHQPYSWPLINRWATSPGIGASQTLIIYSQMIEAYAREKFLWMPYSAVNIATLIPQRVHAEACMWCFNAPVLNFSTFEWYNGDRVMRQFGCKQFVPVEPQQFADVHEDQHIAEPDSEDQVLNTSEQWVDTFCDESQSSSYNPDIGGSSSYHPDMGDSSSYHPDMGGSSSYHPDIDGSSLFDLEQPLTLVDMFGNNMYSTPPQATIDPVANPLDMYNTP
ncbi:hypothetical protein PVK06_019941 [Gossypium arboreum]|uniref:Aminotransferase-like plant mobile domain-containing protein n=1 Tax=Gossypium arboreum TaxID=29729 RepID=A0ABR0PL46_GOSAR|nr:hypothetical protein PVK06_019941 [Gossypium arboreum]